MTLADVAVQLAIYSYQSYARVRLGELPAIQIGGRNQWRVEVDELEKFIERKYAEARQAREKSRA